MSPGAKLLRAWWLSHLGIVPEGSVVAAAPGTWQAKYNMSMCALGMSEEFKGQVAFNCLWPRTAIATAAIEMLAGSVGMKASRSVRVFYSTCALCVVWHLYAPVFNCRVRRNPD
jgi:hypothetical protein